ncbi:acyltransferase [Pseudomonas chlororaphis]|uniref:acyltransferase family protein n=1 Tax=Pseudomonas chlororaphis TaxID=587753 RepID=UPI001E500ABD|nr:acyltransferase [Pseudomonas chlororaphis]MCB2251783.1 acyltransferase [Pseudomonas chlororaphis]
MTALRGLSGVWLSAKASATPAQFLASPRISPLSPETRNSIGPENGPTIPGVLPIEHHPFLIAHPASWPYHAPAPRCIKKITRWYKMNNSGKLDWVQALRGIAAMLVVLCHAREYLAGSPNYPLIESIFLPGAMGVDLFFIISGFIMVYSTRNSAGTLEDVKDFAIKRFSRIWPTYTVATILWVFIADAGISYFSSTDNLIVFLKSIFFIPVKDMAPLYFAPIIPLGWTLNFEMYFYAVFGVSLLFKRFRLIAMITWIGLTVVCLPMLTRVFSFSPFTFYTFAPNYLNLMANPIILEFVAGALIGHMYLTDWIAIKNKAIAFNSLALSIGAVIWYNYSGPAYLHGITNWGAPLILVVLVLAIVSKTFHIQTPAALTWLGKISFSLYLTHFMTRAVMDYSVAYLGFGQFMHTWGYVVLSVISCISMAAVSQYLLEQKLSDAFKNAIQRRKQSSELSVEA